jgi:hypothetical protein
MANISPVDICNIALLRLGTKKIVSFSDTADSNAQKCASLYDPCRRTVLREFPWNFASQTVSAVLANDEISIPNWDYAYTYPANCNLLKSVFNDYTNRINKITEVYEIQKSPLTGDSSKIIVTNCAPPAYVNFSYDVTDTTLFDDYFTSALAWRVAYELAPVITADKQKTQLCFQMYQRDMDQAGIQQRMEEHTNPLQRVSPYISSRG